jgi:hypothetical protein
MIRSSLFYLIIALSIPLSAKASPRSINDCEKIKEAEAYNLCLASFGPVRGQHNKTYPGVASDGAASTDPTRSSPPSSRRGASGRRTTARQGHFGRMRLELTPKHH